jgi:hypothetical protein
MRSNSDIISRVSYIYGLAPKSRKPKSRKSKSRKPKPRKPSLYVKLNGRTLLMLGQRIGSRPIYSCSSWRVDHEYMSPPSHVNFFGHQKFMCIDITKNQLLWGPAHYGSGVRFSGFWLSGFRHFSAFRDFGFRDFGERPYLLMWLLSISPIKVIWRKFCPNFRPNSCINSSLIILKLNSIDSKLLQYLIINLKTRKLFDSIMTLLINRHFCNKLSNALKLKFWWLRFRFSKLLVFNYINK